MNEDTDSSDFEFIKGDNFACVKNKQCSSYMFLESDRDKNVLSIEPETSTPIKSSAIGPEPDKISFIVPIEKLV